jgi:hypothetical protein
LTTDDALYRFRLRALALAQELGNVRAACRAMGIHPSTFYRWRHQARRFGPEILRPRERRRPKMANQTSPFVEQHVVAFSLGHPGFGPARISAEPRRDKWGGIVISLKRGPLGASPPRPEHPGPPPRPGGRHAAPPEPEHREPRRSGISMSPDLGRWSRWTASSSADCPEPRGRCGSTPRSTWAPLTAGPSCTSPPATLLLGGPPNWPGG